MRKVPRILVVGSSGQLARSLIEQAQSAGVELLSIGRPDVDLETFDKLPEAAIAFSPTLIVNAAAYTAVDKAETDEDTAYAVNAEGTGRLAIAAAQCNVPILHVSTDYVFNGGKESPYREDDAIDPQSAYGRTKAEGERRVAGANDQHIVLRTAWVFSPFGANFVKTMLRLAATRDRLGVVDDQHGNPTYAPDLADAILAIAKQIAETGWRDAYRGVFHAAGNGETTWCGLAREVMTVSAARGGPSADVDAITTAEYPTPAQRPANSRLDCGKLRDVFGIQFADWTSGVERCVDRLLAEQAAAD